MLDRGERRPTRREKLAKIGRGSPTSSVFAKRRLGGLGGSAL